MSETMEKAVDKDRQLKVFIQDPTFKWLPAQVIATDGADLVKVQIQLPAEWSKTTLLTKKSPKLDKTERWVNLNDYHNHELPQQNSKAVRDIAELAHLHEAAILYQIKARHASKQPYTRVGEIIIAVNPCQWIDGLYSQDLQRLYAKHFVWQVPVGEGESTSEEKKDENIVATSSTSFESFYDRLGHEPHIYEVSASAYRGLTLDGKDQTILVSGESGAGKTETVKLVLRHLSTIDMAALSADISPKNKTNEDMINYVVESSPVFEAFGNARTCSNHNSSRFGKVTRLHFALGDVGMYTLAGSSFRTYLLETSRVANHSPGERCFHIFYQLLAASSSFKAEHLGEEWTQATASNFRYLSGMMDCGTPGETDADIWETTLEALEFFDWKGYALTMLLGALGIVLRLGNLCFGELSEGEARIETQDELELLAKIIGIPTDVIEKAMTRRSLKTRQDELSVPLSCESAKEGCDALAKKLYSRIFASVVRNINEQTSSPGSEQHNVVSLIDIFGFERFVVNRYEQLCINYTNEALQHKYVKDNLQRHRVEYEKEGLQWLDMKQFDNTETLELFEGTKGIINALTEESVLPNGNNASFVFKVKAAHKDHGSLIDEKLHMKTEFGIRHFAGPVIYDASEFIERNSDKLPDSLLHLATRSANPLVALEFGELVRLQQADDASDSSRKTKMTTVMERFRSQLRELVDEMSQTHIRYIRCIKPSEVMTPASVDHDTIMRQLKCAGLVTAIEITRETFPNKLPFKVVEERFKCLLSGSKAEMMATMEPEEKAQFMMSALYAPEIQKFNSSNFTMPYACGKTKVFYRAGSLEILETARHEYLSASATQLQAWVRKVKAIVRYQKALRAARVIQAWGRRFMAESLFKKLKNAAIRLQAWVRCTTKRRVYVREVASGARLVAACRCFLLFRRRIIKRDVNKQQDEAATTICNWYRGQRFRFERRRALLLEASPTLQESIPDPVSSDQSPNRFELKAVPCSAVRSEVHAVDDDQCQRRQKGDLRRSAAKRIQVWTRVCRDRRNFARFLSTVVCIQTRYRFKCALGKPFELRPASDVPNTVELFGVSSISTIHDGLDIESEKEVKTPDNNERTRFVNKVQDVLEEKLLRELDQEKRKVSSLEQEIAQMRDDAELHAQEIEADFEERINGYEEEVLSLKQEVHRLEAEKGMHEEEMRQTDEAHKKNIQRLQYEIKKIQSSHRDYLDKIMGLLDDTETAQKLQISRINEELEAIKRDRDATVSSLKEEIKLLRSIGFGAKKKQSASESALQLSRKLYAILAADNLLLVVKEAQQQRQGTPQHYIEDKLSSKARNMISYLEEIVSVAEYEVNDARIRCAAIEDEVGALQQQLVCAYEDAQGPYQYT